jgi:hypothetical protein
MIPGNEAALAAAVALHRKLVATLIVVIVLAALVLLIRWDLRRECVRWATRIDSTGYAAYQTSVCVEYR